jgi:fumarylacetoacetase
MFRGVDNALQPNYTHLPVGYHGRSSSVVVSGTPIKRPSGQILLPGNKMPIFSACRKLDIELEMGAFVCKENQMGTPINIANAKEYIFGLVLMNDWSARDIQAWEYVPLGPFLSKNFGTTISPWIILSCALEPFLDVGLAPGNRDELLPYLREDRAANAYNIELTVELTTKTGTTTIITKTNAKNLLYSYPQMLAHHSVSGCPMRVGDLLGTGTISGETRESLGSLLEQSLNGKEAIALNGGEERMFLEDGDEVTIRGVCVGQKGSYVGFGECSGRIVG